MLNSNIKVGMDIGGTLTKIAIMIDKNDDVLCNYLKENLFDKSEEIKIEGHYIYLKRFLSANFNSEAIPFLQRNESVNSRT